MPTIDIKKLLPDELKSQEFWEGISDAFSTELENLKVIIENKRKLYNIYALEDDAVYSNSNDELISLIKSYGGYLDISLNDTPEYIRQQIELFKFFIQNKSRYPFYNFAYKMASFEGDTFIYFWNGNKMVRAIDNFSLVLQSKIDSNTIDIPIYINSIKNYDMFVIGDNLLDVDPPLEVDSAIPWYLDQSYSRITTKHTACEVFAGSYDKKIIGNSRYNIFDSEFEKLENLKFSRNDISSDYLTSYISEDIFAEINREFHSFTDTTNILDIEEKEITITRALNVSNVSQYIDQFIPLQIAEYSEIKGIVKSSTLNENATTKHISIYRKNLLDDDSLIGTVSINSITREFTIPSTLLIDNGLLVLKVEDNSQSYGPPLVSGAYYGNYYSNITVIMYDISGTKTQLPAYYNTNCFVNGITLFKRNEEYVSYGEIRLISNNALLNITQIKTTFPTSFVNKLGTAGLDTTTDSPLDNKATLIDISNSILAYCYYHKEENAIELIDEVIKYMYSNDAIPFIFDIVRKNNFFFNNHIRVDAILFFLNALLSFIEIFSSSEKVKAYLALFENIYQFILSFRSSNSSVIDLLVNRGNGVYSDASTFDYSYTSDNYYFIDNYLLYLVTKRANTILNDTSYNYSTIAIQLDTYYDSVNKLFYQSKDLDNTPDTVNINSLDLIYGILYSLEKKEYTIAENIKETLDLNYLSLLNNTGFELYNGDNIACHELSFLAIMSFYHLDSITYLENIYTAISSLMQYIDSNGYNQYLQYSYYSSIGENGLSLKENTTESISTLLSYIFSRGKVKTFLLSNEYSIQYDDSYIIGASEENSLIQYNNEEYLMTPEYMKFLSAIIKNYSKVTDVNHIGIQLNLLCDKQGYFNNKENQDYSIPSIKTKCAVNSFYNENMIPITDVRGIMVGRGSHTIPNQSSGVPLNITALDDFVLYNELDLEEKFSIETDANTWNCVFSQVQGNSIKAEIVDTGSSSIYEYSGQTKFYPVIPRTAKFRYVSSGGYKIIEDRENILQGKNPDESIFATGIIDYTTGEYSIYTKSSKIIESEILASVSLGNAELNVNLIYGTLDVGNITISYDIDNYTYQMIDVPDDISNTTGTFKLYENTSNSPYGVISATITYATREIIITFANDTLNVDSKYSYTTFTYPDNGTTIYIDYSTEDNISITEAAIIGTDSNIIAYATFPPIVLGSNQNHISLQFMIYNGEFY